MDENDDCIDVVNEMIEDGAIDSDMMDATDDISSGDDLVPMEGAPTE